MWKRAILSAEEEHLVKSAVEAAERNTSGEIRVHIDRYCKGDVLDMAAEVFARLGMHQTALRNGVLIYLAADDHKFSIIGDAGINQKVPEGFWDNIRDMMQDHFRHRRFCEGLCAGIKIAGEKLKEHFPYQHDDRNELSDDVSFGEHED